MDRQPSLPDIFAAAERFARKDTRGMTWDEYQQEVMKTMEEQQS